MLRRKLLIVICLMICFSLGVNAAEPRAYPGNYPELEYEGTTAICTFSHTAIGKHIVITMELWNGSTLIDSWTKSGTHSVSFNETCEVDSGQIYRLKITGTSGGVAIPTTSVTSRCP